MYFIKINSSILRKEIVFVKTARFGEKQQQVLITSENIQVKKLVCDIKDPAVVFKCSIVQFESLKILPSLVKLQWEAVR